MGQQLDSQKKTAGKRLFLSSRRKQRTGEARRGQSEVRDDRQRLGNCLRHPARTRFGRASAEMGRAGDRIAA
jgi:hypothetical protein